MSRRTDPSAAVRLDMLHLRRLAARLDSLDVLPIAARRISELADILDTEARRLDQQHQAKLDAQARRKAQAAAADNCD